jgi:hypothetical protein
VLKHGGRNPSISVPQSILIDIYISAAGSAIDVNRGTGSVEWDIMPLPGS